MAALYSPDGFDTKETQSLVHSRNLSTLSNSPLLPNRTVEYHPIEPLLLSPPAPIPTGNEDISPAGLSQNPLRRSATPISQFPTLLAAFKRWSKVITLSLELVLGIWATYSTVRYSLAYSHYRNTLGQDFSLAITAGISAVLTFFAMAISTYFLRLLSRQDCKKCHSILLCLRILAALFLLAPATINVVLAFVWKTSPNPDLNLHSRCHLDVDVVWSIAHAKCATDAPSWPLWVALSFIRFLLTASLIIIYLIASFFSPSKSSHRHSRWLGPHVGSNGASLARITSLTDHHPSDLTLDATIIGDSSSQSGQSRSALSRSFDTSLDYGRTPTLRDEESDPEMSRFVDRFRSLITQITREVESSLEVARSDGPPLSETDGDYTSIPKPYPSPFIIDSDNNNYPFSRYDKDNMFNLPPVPMALGYNEFGVPYPPEENVRVLGGFIRRMPTIESMGSDEMTSRSSVSHRHDAGNRASSRRTTLLTITTTTGHDIAGHDPPSRANSLSNRVERLLSISPISTTSEHGELLGRTEQRLSTPSSNPSSGDFTFRSLSSGTDGTTSSERTYHTAVMHDDTHVEENI